MKFKNSNLKFVKIKPTNNCQSRCITCNYWKEKFENELSYDQWLGLIKEIREVGISEIMITGGEPTLFKKLDELVLECKNNNYKNISITTNSLSLNDRRIDNLVKNGINEFVLSFEGLNTHDKIRGIKGNSLKVIKNIDYLKEVNFKNIKIAFTIMSANIDEIPDIIEFTKKKKIKILFNLIDDQNYFFNNIDKSLMTFDENSKLNRMLDLIKSEIKKNPEYFSNDINSIEYAEEYFKDPKMKSVPCYLGHYGFEIDSNGDFYTNCWSMKPVGNIKQTKLLEIIKSQKFLNQIDDMYKKKCDGCSCGYILNSSINKLEVGENLKSFYSGY
jgi:MoaA/NifB/PqqE/SkfB family radical SAM enzyme